MPVISFASSKGGAGKTTSAIILGTELASSGTTVTLIDADPAHRLTNWSKLRQLETSIDVIQSAGERAILDEIDNASRKTAFVIVDLEGSASRLTSYAIGESDLVIVPSGEEQQDADAAIETLAEVSREGRTRRKEISSAVLFCRTNAAVKSRLERHISSEMEQVAPVFKTQLNRRTAFSSLHNYGGGLRSLDQTEVNQIPKAIENAQAFAAEVVELLTAKET